MATSATQWHPRLMLTPTEVAAYLQVSGYTVGRMIRGGRLPATMVGRQYRVSVEQLERWVDDHAWFDAKAAA